MGGGFGSKLGSASGHFAMVACKLARGAGDRTRPQAGAASTPSALITVKVGAKQDGLLTAVQYKSYGSARHRHRRGHGRSGQRDVWEQPELQGRGVRRVHERRPLGPAARARPLAGGLRDRVGHLVDRRLDPEGPLRVAGARSGAEGPAFVNTSNSSALKFGLFPYIALAGPAVPAPVAMPAEPYDL